MAVRPAHTERGHTRNTGPLPDTRPGLDPQIQFIKINRRIRRLEIQTRRHHPIPHRQRGLDQTDNARRTLQMPDIRLRRTNHQRPRTPRGIPQHHSQRRSLDRITQRRPGSVQFHVTDLARRHTRTLTRKPQHPGLTLHPRSRQTITTTIIVDRTTRDHTHHIITISDRILQPLQNNKTPTLTPHITIRPTIENKRTPIRRQPTELRHRHRRLRRQHQIHPTRQRQRHLTTTQRLTRLMHRHQRRRLTRIHHQRRTRQTQQKRHPIRDHTPRK
ncbi:hypothetical protein, partial [Streptomyces sp. SID7909]|uniref:hypothetical protein n=1 Tax=Streptomyces sp. SID7909 TaxID=2706092 RepID=UPI001EF2FB0E